MKTLCFNVLRLFVFVLAQAELQPQDETDMFTFNETRAENLQIMRHRMANLYDTKEAARRARNWDRAGKWDGPEVENARLDGIQ